MRLLSPRAAYDALAASYEDWHWYQFWRVHERPLVSKWLRSITPGRGLDAGAGTGPYESMIADLGASCVAADISREMLKAVTAPSIPVQADLTALPFRAGAFDWTLCSRVLSHVADLDAAVGELARTLKPGGECLMTDVHPEHAYDHVRIPGPSGMIGIETYKHAVEDVTASAKRHGLLIESLATYRLGDLTEAPPRPVFAKLYEHPERPIFYAARMIRRP